ncbi:MAG: hypothetical protein KGJ79_04815 [Alphaproteobacteria bacterium]|nr:hypothetical protein [Alphaproteobacteria bacterium]MDE2110444.1 hypothetical protein [Alphaproteobacteria bacterium]MDE2493397.1 hypothetical protein [Alphaproteobacteria bacterium]
MKKRLVRAVLVAGLSVFAAGAVLTATQAVAASSDSDKDAPKISRSINKPISDAQKALQTKDWATALADLKEAQGASDLTDYDKYIINYFTGLAAYNSGDKATATTAFLAAAESTAAPASEHASVLRIAMELQNEADNYAKVIELAKLSEQAGPLDPTVAGIVASAYYNSKDYANAQKYAQQSIDGDLKAGKIPDHTAYQIVLLSQNRQKDIPGETKTLETMAQDYGNADDWGNLLDISLSTLPTSSKGFREIGALFIYRLRTLVGATTSAEDYKLSAQLALGLRDPGDAQRALEQGLSKGAVNQATVGALLQKANAAARTDEPSLPAAEAAAAKSKSGKEDVLVAEGYFGYGKYADAIRVARRALAKGGREAIEAQMLIGAAQASSGDNAAAQSLAAVKGDPILERAAQLWSLYATRKYGLAAAAPAPASH